MKKNKWVIPVLIIVIIIILGIVYYYTNQRTFELRLPEIDKVVSINLSEGIQSKYLSDNNKITDIFNNIKNSNYKTHKESINDMPKDVNKVIKVTFNYESEIATSIFIYNKNNKYYIEQPYNGIYEINSELYEKIKSYLK